MKGKVLVVDDEPDVIDLVRYHLRRAGYEVTIAETGGAALRQARAERPDAIVLDLMLPEMSGMEVCRELKLDANTRDIPILMLTAKGQTSDRISGLETGADDYITKPFSPKELTLRITAILNRLQQSRKKDVLEVDDFIVDRANFEILLAGNKLELTITEFKLLALLIERRGRTQSRETLLYDVWGYKNLIDTRTVDTHMRRLREKLESHSNRITTVRGEGYRFAAEPLP